MAVFESVSPVQTREANYRPNVIYWGVFSVPAVYRLAYT